MSDNYAVINGKKIELTEEHLKALGVETQKNPFKRVAAEERVKIFVDELSKSRPMLDYQKELLIRAIVNGCHNYLPYELEMKWLGRLYYAREMAERLCGLLFF